MSGGHFNNENDYLANRIYYLSPDYGNKGRVLSVVARRMNPFEDKMISELIWDVFCLMHSYDYYASGDICEETYRKDIDAFKEKWIRQSSENVIKREIELTLREMKTELYRSLGVVEDGKADEA